MFPRTIVLKNQEKLKYELQKEVKASKLENLAAALLGRLLDVPIATAKSGFQHGGDAGTAGKHGRRFRIECKKYSDTTRLSDRELLGEIDQALSRDHALEAWFLIATRSVPEQLAQDLSQKGEEIGVPIVIIDWTEYEFAPLAALCAFDPNVVDSVFSKEAGAFARKLQPLSDKAIEMLKRDLQSWSLGFETLRMRSQEVIDKIWNSKRESNVRLGQDAAGGERSQKVKRRAVNEAFGEWWKGPAKFDAPAAVVGWDGVGKTWATLDWLVDSMEAQPIILVVPSSAIAVLSGISEINVKRFLADRLYDLSGVRDSKHWMRRINYLLRRPIDEGPVLTLFFDGLNQEPSFPWLSLLKILQGDTFSGKVRIIISTRKHHFDNKLSKLQGLIEPTVPIILDVYSTEPGGELDRMLSFEGLSQDDLHPELIEMARTPRLFNLVVRFRDRLIAANKVTVHRLLWEYGRDTFGERAGRSFSEDEWRAWLKEIAQKYRDGIREFSVKSLGETASRPDLSTCEVYARLSDIIDGQFAKRGPSGNLQLTPTIVAHALGTALIAHLDQFAESTYATLDSELAKWFDPIAGFDQRSEILRAAVSILLERSCLKSSLLPGALVTAWLQTQNVTDSHRKELAIVAPYICDALLDAVEHSDDSTHASARLWAVNALRAIPRSDVDAINKIIKRSVHWLSIVSRDVKTHPDSSVKFEEKRSDWFKHRIGKDSSGQLTVVGVNLEIVDRKDGILQSIVPSILEGFNLVKATPVFEVAAVALTLRYGHDEGWDGLKWLCLLNEIDPDETAESLRELSLSVKSRKPELGVNPDLPARVASLLFWLSGQEQDEDSAALIDSSLDRALSYEKDYLANPSRSLFSLERRHVEITLNNPDLPVSARVQRTKEQWLDPDFIPPESFIKEIRTASAAIDTEKLNRHHSFTFEDHRFEEIEPVLARCSSDLLADMVHRKMKSIANCPAKARYWSSICASHHLILLGEAEAEAAFTLRMSSKEADEKKECYAASKLLMMEIKDLGFQAQIDKLIHAELAYILTDFAEVLHPPTPDDVDAMIARYSSGSSKQLHDLTILLSIHPVEFSKSGWSWFESSVKHDDHDLRGIVFEALYRADAIRFGRMLEAENWSWNPEAAFIVNHYGTIALVEATRSFPFGKVVPRLAPWRLLEAARIRGADPIEVQIAAEVFGHVLAPEGIEVPDLGSILSVGRTKPNSLPFLFSISPLPNDEDSDDPIAALKQSIDTDEQLKEYNRAVETAVSRIDAIRKSGARLYLADMTAEDFGPLLQHSPEKIERWLEGYHELSSDFRCRVCLAEAAYLALCEALLIHDPTRGIDLWRALRATVTTRYVGDADIEDLLHMVFRVPDSPAVITLREELVELMNCYTDKSLFDLAIAAAINGKTDWLSAIIKRDKESNLAWKRKRGVVLEGFTVQNHLPVEGAWPNAEIKTSYAELKRKSARFQWIEACAHHWWRVYLKSQDPAEAYAAWVLFLRSADRRALTWMGKNIKALNDNSAFFKHKLSHVQLNRSTLERAMKKREDKLDRQFLNRQIIKGLGPWRM